MKDIEKNLNNLPKGRLSLTADLRIRYRMWRVGREMNAPMTSMAFSYRAVALSLLLVILAGSATGTYAYSSPEVVRGNILYPVKRGIEKVEARLVKTPQAEVVFHNKLAERRLAEADVLSRKISADGTAKKPEAEFDDTIAEAGLEISNTNKVAQRIDDGQERESVFGRLADNNLEKVEKMKILANRLGLATSEDTTEKIASVMEDTKEGQRRLVLAISQYKDGKQEKIVETGTTTATAARNFINASSTLNELQKEADNLTEELRSAGRYDQKQVIKLEERVDKKIDQASTALKEGQIEKFSGLSKAASALINNGKHFLKEEAPKATSTPKEEVKKPNRPRPMERRQERSNQERNDRNEARKESIKATSTQPLKASEATSTQATIAQPAEPQRIDVEQQRAISASSTPVYEYGERERD